MGSTRKIAIVGAGPCGLVAALEAAQLGLNVEVFEQAPSFSHIGGGLLLHSNGLRVLNEVGLGVLLKPYLRDLNEMVIETYDGRMLQRLDLSQVNVPWNRAAIIARAELQELLVKAVQEMDVKIRFGHRLTSMDVSNAGVFLRFQHHPETQADLVVACDGVHSMVRKHAGADYVLSPSHGTYIRGIVHAPPNDPLLTDLRAREIWGPDGRRFGLCPLAGNRVYFYASAPEQGWQHLVSSRKTRLAWIQSWRDFGAEIIAILLAVPDWSKVSHSDSREVHMEKWWHGPIFFAGDAAHAMTPNLGQGANSAMTDSYILMQMIAELLEKFPGIYNDLWRERLNQLGEAYTSLRKPFVTRIQNLARQTGQMSEWKSPWAQSVRNKVMSTLIKVPSLNETSLKVAMGFNPDEQAFFDLT